MGGPPAVAGAWGRDPQYGGARRRADRETKGGASNRENLL